MAERQSPKKKRTSRFGAKSLFASRTSNKFAPSGTGVHLKRSLGNHDPRGADISMEEGSFDRRESRESTASRLRRGGSKILSIFGLRKSDGAQSSAERSLPSSNGASSNVSSNPAVEREIAIEIARDAACPDSNPATSYLFNHGTGSTTPIPITVSPTARIQESCSRSPPHHSDPEKRPPFDGRPRTPLRELSQPAAVAPDQPLLLSPVLLHSSRSSPGLTHMLSHKISTTFSYPTIVHRPHRRSRPSVPSIETTVVPQPEPPHLDLFPVDTRSEPVPHSSQELDSAGAQTDPSSHLTSGNTSSPPGGMPRSSTEKTSLTSENSARKISEYRRAIQPLLVKSKSLSVLATTAIEGAVPPLAPSPPAIVPTIRTVETTASAKIFFETHFNTILQTAISPRSQRRRDLEHRLHTVVLTAEQRNRERRDWSRCESEHLRQLRVMKAKIGDQTGHRGVSVAGYEVVKILGKGSFGVVRLVRERDDAPGMIPTAERVLGVTHERDVSTRRPAIEALRSSVHRRSGRRRGGAVSSQVYAMKVIRKSEMIRNAQEGHLRAERDFLVGSEGSRWVVPLVASFQDKTNLYLVMDYMVGGDFLGLLIRKHTLSEDVTRWYIAEMILCVEEAHAMRWIHRDVKPDNFLISASGHLKISDFGLAFDGHWAHDQAYFNNHRYSLLDKLGIEIDGDTLDRKEGKRVTSALAAGAPTETTGPNRHEIPEEDDEAGPLLEGGVLGWRNRTGKRVLARSMVGTSQYMAPEVIKSEPYDGRCDWWSVGIILYECLYGYTPFCMETRQDTKLKIVQHATSLTFPSDITVSHRATTLIEALLRDKEVRLCSKQYAFNDYRLSRPHDGPLVAVRADTSAPDYKGRFVYPDDAADIKAHPFFRGIQWERIHAMKPPFVPKVKSWEDTKYFEEDEPVSDVDDASSYSSAQEKIAVERTPTPTPAAAAPDVRALRLPTPEPGNPWAAPKETNDALEAQNARLQQELKAAKVNRKEKRRPRDKILRDREVGREVLEIRKRGAFLGYTYRRPRGYASGTLGGEESGSARRGTQAREEKMGMGSGVMKMGMGGGGQFGV